ncbi:hypothetical protein [Burkholderia sp. Se-20378]|uniref:hypothetical protein n=1 Tax=Burkholderia sp. Se-20378 TaxID=2703899 RepID=UPI00197E4CC0|nr:hypothetical protein [Burkholderia sp. Se-20378]MBN3770712.1 hypothetical protein [Burkholderia sp. Se-20378]
MNSPIGAQIEQKLVGKLVCVLMAQVETQHCIVGQLVKIQSDASRENRVGQLVAH